MSTATSTVNLSVRVDTERKAKLEALAHDYGDCSQSAVIRQYIEEQYHHVFGELDPEALASGHITDEQNARSSTGLRPRTSSTRHSYSPLKTKTSKLSGRH